MLLGALLLLLLYVPLCPGHIGLQQSKLTSKLKHDEAPEQFCSHNSRPTKFRANYHSRSKRENSEKPRRLAYFDGSEHGILWNDANRRMDFIREQFTIAFWIKPEGGQERTAVVASLSDTCERETRQPTWQIGLRIMDGASAEKEAKFFFSLRTEMAPLETTLWAPDIYTPLEWTHVAATYDGTSIAFYVNGARVGLSDRQGGVLYSELRSHCKGLYLGQWDYQSQMRGFRGSLSELRLWQTAQTHTDIVDLMRNTVIHEHLAMEEEFADLNKWQIPTTNIPTLQTETQLNGVPEFEVKVPPCGQTVCDDPNVVRSYASNWELRQPKNVRYRLVNLLEMDGSNSCVSADQIRRQHQALNKAFNLHNISWQLGLVELQSTSLRRKTIVFGCDSAKIGNGQCDPECRHPVTGNDGGDCDQHLLPCEPALLGNNRCDSVCNKREYNWDNGQCCNVSKGNVHQTCIDPTSPLRAYIGVDEYKTMLNFSNQQSLTVTFAQWSNQELIGLSTFPWEKEVYSIHGGVVLQPEKFGTSGHLENLIHEVGHALGLWHVHHGVTEMPCDDLCRENEPSFLTGDLVEDTKPTPKNLYCRDPERTFKIDNTLCEPDKVYVDTPYNNFMSYAGEECTNHFTPQQAARMHCYLDLKYRNWLEGPQENERFTSIIPLSPRIIDVSQSTASITFGWVPPLGHEVCRPLGSELGQAECSVSGRVTQFAARATSNGPFKLSGYWAPIQAIGPPDAEPCEASTKAWLPDVQSCDETDSCVLFLEPELPLPIERLSLWVAWNAANGIEQVRLHFEDGATLSYRHITAFCDMPFTLKLYSNKSLSMVEVKTRNPFVSIDALELISTPNQPLCASCERLTYRIRRNPPFPSGHFVQSEQRKFTDSDLEQNIMYEYQVSVVNGSLEGHLSPPLRYQLNQSFCGDGIADDEEQCDDGNNQDSDGCSSSCETEAGYNCKGEPSLCYVYAGDGVCEMFEEAKSVEDCGHYTPPGYDDQWPMRATVSSHMTTDDCPAIILIGSPRTNMCTSSVTELHQGWTPCPTVSLNGLELHLVYARPVVVVAIVVHLASDGVADFGSEPKFLDLHLIDTNNKSHKVIGSESKYLGCGHNPVVYPVLLDLSQEVVYSQQLTIRLSSHSMAISGVRLRSWQRLDPKTVDACEDQRLLYEPKTQQCVRNQCLQPACPSISVPNAQLNCNGQGSGDFCTVECQPGYWMQNGERSSIFGQPRFSEKQLKVFCFNGRWSPRSVSCRPVDCHSPIIAHANVQCTGTTVGKRCNFHCTQPALMRGTENVLVCNANGMWSVPEAYCQLSCPAPELISRQTKSISKHCRIYYRNLDASSISFPVGTRCKFVCQPGYHVQEQEPARRLFRMTCNSEGQWTGPRCVPIQCPEPKIVYYGLYNCTRRYQVGSECRFFCPGTSESRLSRCQMNGKWSLTRPCDLPKATCHRPIATQDFVLDCPPKTFVGSVCRVKCAVYGYESVIEHVVTTERGFQMQLLQHVANVTCTGQRIWEPDSASLACVKKCTKEFLGDGTCDFQNNRGYCGWDGGDCCASTAKTGKVKLLFPKLCTSHLCQCLDPYAIENRNDLEHAKVTPSLDSLSSNQTTKPPPLLFLSSTVKLDRSAVEWLNNTMAEFETAASFRLHGHNDTDARQNFALLTAFTKRLKLAKGRAIMARQYLSRIRSSILRALRKQYQRLQVKS